MLNIIQKMNLFPTFAIFEENVILNVIMKKLLKKLILIQAPMILTFKL